ncbi:MAG: MBL fold metallo-hydrolase [Thermoguttaceae bacterium]|nr:MBL fold metallo-hydrolase [Thermoguttaceae bacterium]
MPGQSDLCPSHTDDRQIVWDTVVSSLFEENSYIVRRADAAECFIVDPGFEPDSIIAYVHKKRLTPRAILITHGHVDHMAGLSRVKERWPEANIITGLEDAEKLVSAQANLSAFFGVPLVGPPADVVVVDGELLEVAGINLLVRQIPGHSRGHVVFICENTFPPVVFVGDVIFAGSIGRTDFPDGDYKQLIEGIRRVLFVLPEETILLPGHGPPTSVGREKLTNPYVGTGLSW